MRVSVSISVVEGTCSRCGTENVPVIPFCIVVDDHGGDADPLCGGCLFYREGLRVDVTMQDLAPGPASRRKGLRKARKVSQQQERDIAEELRGRTQPGSGNQRGAKGDVRVHGKLRVEAKFTTAGSYSLHLDDLYKIAGECGVGEKPVLVIDYRESGTSKLKDRFAVVHFQDLKDLLHAPDQHR
jgi:hypothetical protein